MDKIKNIGYDFAVWLYKILFCRPKNGERYFIITKDGNIGEALFNEGAFSLGDDSYRKREVKWYSLPISKMKSWE